MICTPPDPRRHDRPDDSFVACSPDVLEELARLRVANAGLLRALEGLCQTYEAQLFSAHKNPNDFSLYREAVTAIAQAREAGL